MKKLDEYKVAGLRFSGLLILVVICSFALTIYAEETKDKEAPKIKVLENNLVFYDDEEINFLDYVEVSDNSERFDVYVVDEEDALLPGDKQVQIEAIDINNNVADVYLNVTIVSLEEWNEYVINKTNNYFRRRIENEEFEKLKGNVDYNAFHLAENFVGMPGGCNEVAQAFINSYFGEGYDVFSTYPISKEEAMPGDVIFYEDGGLGYIHYAVYLGGASALQGNIYGTTVLGSVYMTYGSEPLFYRLNGR